MNLPKSTSPTTATCIFFLPDMKECIYSDRINILKKDSVTTITSSLILGSEFLKKYTISDISDIKNCIYEYTHVGDKFSSDISYCELYNIEMVEYDYTTVSFVDDRLYVDAKFNCLSSRRENSIKQYVITNNRSNVLNSIL